MQQVDDPPSLPVGTEVSAKYKGAFCEAKVRKVVRNIKVKVVYKQGLGSGIVPDDAIKTRPLRVGATVEVRPPDKKETVEATITKIQDCSQYTVVFDDGDITTLRRTALCLKSGRHFNESETLDQLPLTHPEHFGNPVVGGRRGRRSRHLHEESSDDDEESDAKEVVNEKEEHIGKVVSVESTETKKKDKEKWFPGLVVAPTTQVTVRIRVKDEYLVRSFKDGRYYTVPKKEATEFTREAAAKQDTPAVQAALEYLDNDVLPPHWDRDALFGLSNSTSEYEGELDSDSSDDEPREEKDHFVAQLYKYMDDRGTPLNKVPSIQNRDVDLYRLFRTVQKLGGYNRVTSQNQWKPIATRLGFTPATLSVSNLVKQAYKKFLQPYEDFHRKLGCSLLNSRNSIRSKGRSLVRANSVASPKPVEPKEPKEPKLLPSVSNPISSVPIPSTTVSPTSTAAELPVPPSTPIIAPPLVLDPVAEESENTSESSVELPKVKRKSSIGSAKVKTLVEKFEDKSKEDSEPSSPSTKSLSRTSSKDKDESKDKADPENPAKILPMPNLSGPLKRDPKNPKKPPSEEKIRGSGRKKKDLESSADKSDKPTESLDFPVDVGDKLRVYYHEKKVTYEAKVIEISLTHSAPLYLVHYTGWNNRYDEWVPRERIAENISNSKSKKNKSSHGEKHKHQDKSDTPRAEKNLSGPSSIPPNTGNKMSGTKRGRGRSDSQPPRSTTPSSIASGSSRTKSPATSNNQRRTTRMQPSSRRTSNNISDVSMPSDTDSDDSDEPVKKPTRTMRERSKTFQGTHKSSGPPILLKSNNTNSPSDSDDDESLPLVGRKGRDYDLNQIRNEMKGCKDIKPPTPDPDIEIEIDSDFKLQNLEYQVKDENLDISPTLKDETAKSSSTDLSSETDSFADDESQSSDKTTTLANMTEKLQLKIKAEKAKTLEKYKGSAEKMSPLVSGIEQIIIDSQTEKRQESLRNKPFYIEKNVFKDHSDSLDSEIDKKEKSESTKMDVKPLISKATIFEKRPSSGTTDVKPVVLPSIIAGVSGLESNSSVTSADLKASPIKMSKLSAASEKVPVSPNRSTVKDIPLPAQPHDSCIEPLLSVVKPILNEKEKSSIISSLDKSLGKESSPIKKIASLTSSPTSSDIYEFKEPEPFEFEARKSSNVAQGIQPLTPENEKSKRKLVNQQKSLSTEESVKSENSPTTAHPTNIFSTKKRRGSPIKESSTEKPKQNKSEDNKPGLTDIKPLAPLLLTPIKTNETTFDVLRKSPSFNLNMNALNEELATTVHETTKALTDALSVSSDRLTPPKNVKSHHHHTLQKASLSFSSPLIEMKTDVPNVFELKPEVESKLITSDSSLDKKSELESVKKILLSNLEDLEPLKIDKPSSIADKVLKAISEQKEKKEKGIDIKTEEIASTSSKLSDDIVKVGNVVKIEKIDASDIASCCGNMSSLSLITTTDQPKIDLSMSLIQKDLENALRKPILSSPEPRIDILESITRKNNDLSETIQKLESVIQKTIAIPTITTTATIHSNLDEDSSDSTDSERRLVIEDEEDAHSPCPRVVTPTIPSTIKKEIDEYKINPKDEFSPISKKDDTLISLMPSKSSAYTSLSSTHATSKSVLPLTIQHSQSIFGLQAAAYSDTNLLLDSGVKPIIESPCEPTNKTEYEKLSEIPLSIESQTASIMIAMKKEETEIENVVKPAADSQNLNPHTDSINLLLCEETIPGSPTPATKDITDGTPSAAKTSTSNHLHPIEADIMPVPMDIECPASTVNVLSSIIPPNPNLPSTSSANALTKIKKENQTPSSSPHDSLSQDDSSEDLKKQIDIDLENDPLPKKRRRKRKHSEVELQTKRRRGQPSSSLSTKKNIATTATSVGSDSDDNSDTISQRSSSSRPSRPCQYNFLAQLDPAMNPNQRISILRKKIQDLRKIYNLIKVELASIDRRRKKLRRREREKKQQQKIAT